MRELLRGRHGRLGPVLGPLRDTPRIRLRGFLEMVTLVLHRSRSGSGKCNSSSRNDENIRLRTKIWADRARLRSLEDQLRAVAVEALAGRIRSAGEVVR